MVVNSASEPDCRLDANANVLCRHAACALCRTPRGENYLCCCLREDVGKHDGYGAAKEFRSGLDERNFRPLFGLRLTGIHQGCRTNGPWSGNILRY